MGERVNLGTLPSEMPVELMYTELPCTIAAAGGGHRRPVGGRAVPGVATRERGRLRAHRPPYPVHPGARPRGRGPCCLTETSQDLAVYVAEMQGPAAAVACACCAVTDMRLGQM